MAKPERQRAKTLSISLPSDLAEAVAARVATGLYSSSSELIREALRLWIRTEQCQLASAAWPSRVADDTPTPAAARLRSALDLFETGTAIQIAKLRQSEPGLTDEQATRRLAELSAAREVGPGLRFAPERLRELKRRAQA